jgi:hypothetical protein
MPDGRWWMAQNLNYQGYTGKALNPTIGGGIAPFNAQRQFNDPLNTGTINDYLKAFWCAPQVYDAQTGIGTSTTERRDMVAGVDGCETYGALYPWPTVMANDGWANLITDATVGLPVAVNQPSMVRGICPPGWFVPSNYDWGMMLNKVEEACGSGCPATGLNGTGNNLTSPCFHNYTAASQNNWAASRCAFKDLLSTDVAPARDGVRRPALDGTLNNYGTVASGANDNGKVDPNRASITGSTTGAVATDRLQYPQTAYSYATHLSPVWSYYLPETAGTDKYGFSIKPAGMRNSTLTNTSAKFGHFYLGEFAAFWTATNYDGTTTVAGKSTNAANTVGAVGGAMARGFRYNWRHNADYNSAVQSFSWDKFNGFSLRCIAKRDIDL